MLFHGLGFTGCDTVHAAALHRGKGRSSGSRAGAYTSVFPLSPANIVPLRLMENTKQCNSHLSSTPPPPAQDQCQGDGQAPTVSSQGSSRLSIAALPPHQASSSPRHSNGYQPLPPLCGPPCHLGLRPHQQLPPAAQGCCYSALLLLTAAI